MITTEPPIASAPVQGELWSARARDWAEVQALEALVREAGLEPEHVEDVETVWVYGDEATALRGLLSSGPAVRVIAAAAEEPLREAVLGAIRPYRTADGGVPAREHVPVSRHAQLTRLYTGLQARRYPRLRWRACWRSHSSWA